MIDIPTTLQQVTVLSVKLVLHENIPTIFAYTASGQVFFVTLEDQVICKKNLFSSFDEMHYPVTSCMLYSHQNPSHVLKCIVTTMNHSLYHCIIELKKNKVRMTLLATPSLPITAYQVIQSPSSFHLTNSILQDTSIEGKETLVTVLSNNTFLAYDLKDNTRNYEYTLLTWLLPADVITNMDVISYLIYNQKSNVLMAANRDYLAIFKLKREGTKIELSEEVKNDVLHYEVDTLSRLMMYE